MTLSDNELITRSKAGDVSAFEQLVFRYDREVLNIASRFTRSADDAKDIYQETFIRVYKGLEQFKSNSTFATWLFRITTNVCLTYKEKQQKTPSIPMNEDNEEKPNVVAVSDSSADARTVGNEISERIEGALGFLSPKQRLVFTLRHYEEYKIKDIAVMINCAEGTVKKYLFEATQKMRTRLHDLYE